MIKTLLFIIALVFCIALSPVLKVDATNVSENPCCDKVSNHPHQNYDYNKTVVCGDHLCADGEKVILSKYKHYGNLGN